MIDLHSHTLCSDGSLSPEELLDRAKSLGLKAIAITDHDTLDGLKRAISYAKKINITFIPGVEIEIEFPGKGEFHLLGLGLKELDGELSRELKKVQGYRDIRNHEICSRFKKDNIDITMEDLKSVAGGDVIARPHFAGLLVERGYAKNQKRAFKDFLNSGTPYYVAKKAMELPRAIELIHEAGGKAVIAHPQSLYLSRGRIESVLSSYKEMGLDGIEAWHGGNSKKECTFFEKIASNLRLIVSGGSDYHGDNIQGRTLGLGAGERPIPEILLKPFL